MHRAVLGEGREGGARHTSIAAKVHKLQYLVIFLSPVVVFLGVFALERFLLQVVDSSVAGAQSCGISNSTYTANETFFPCPWHVTQQCFALAPASRYACTYSSYSLSALKTP